MKESLFKEFNNISREEWRAVIEKDLKGADFNKLIWRTYENINIQPFYRYEDIKHLTNSIPGAYPYTRGFKTNNSWLICEEIENNETDLISECVNSGVDSIILNGELIKDQKSFNKLLSKINIDKVKINFRTESSDKISEYLRKFIESNNINTGKDRFSIFYDPIKNILNGKNCAKDFTIQFELNELFERMGMLTAHSYPFKSAGGNIVQELAFTLLSGIEYISRLTERGVGVDRVCGALQFSVAVGSNFFMEIAKLRALRLLWAKIVEKYDPQLSAKLNTNIYCHSTDFNKTAYDRRTNILRLTMDCLAAAMGGADEIALGRFDKFNKKNNSFSRRISRNIQHIIKREAYLDKVVDPLGGSYYLETLTNRLAEETLDTVVEIEKEGGLIAAFEKGIVQRKIKENRAALDKNISSCKEVLVGTNKYPDIKEKLGNDFNGTKSARAKADKQKIEPLKLYRASEPFENIRLENEKLAKKNGRSVKIFLFKIGDGAMRSARANFAANLFGCGGFDIVDNKGFNTVHEGIKGALKSGADIVVICSSDKEYKKFAPEITEKIKTAKPNIKVLIAGEAKEIAEELTAKGVDGFIHSKVDLVEILTNYSKLGK